MMSPDEPTICVVCAYRATCQKRFTLRGGPYARCPEFVRDLTIPRDPDPQGDEGGGAKGKTRG